jgi:hypothetical protein
LYPAIGGDVGIQAFLKPRYGGVEIQNFRSEGLALG